MRVYAARVPRHLFRIALVLCVVATSAPLWVGTHLPAVDAPQHLFLARVLRSLIADGESSPFAAVFEWGPRFTYVTFYGGMTLLSSLFGEETALRLWMSLVLGAVPVAMAVFLRAFGRSPWLALLAGPLVYTDNFYWGLFSFQSTLALTLLGLAWCARTLDAPIEEKRWPILLGTSALLLVLTHAAAVPLPALGIVVLLVTSRTDRARRLRALVAMVPSVIVLLLWLFAGVNKKRVTGGEHWSGTGSLLDGANYGFDPIAPRLGKLVELLSNGFWAWADRPPVVATLVALAVALVVGAIMIRRESEEFDWRPVWLFGVALGCYLLLPTDIRGYMYMIHGRYAQLAALFAIGLVPPLRGRVELVAGALATAVAVWAGANLATQFRAFDREAQSLDQVIAALPPHARIMHLVVHKGSRIATHAVYLHAAALAAFRVDGIPSFSLALDPSFPVNYREGRRPPAPEWEWQPERFVWDTQATWYDHYLVRGRTPEQLFRGHVGEVEEVARAGDWLLLRRTPSPLPQGGSVD